MFAAFEHGEGGALLGWIAQHAAEVRSFAAHFARLLPTTILVPAFGLRALPTQVRVAVGGLFALCVYSAPSSVPAVDEGLPLPLVLLGNLLVGLPVAIAAAVPLWAAASAGGLVEQLRGGQEQANSPLVEGRTSPLGVLFAILAALAFLGSGGPSRVVGLLTRATVPSPSFGLRITFDLLAGVEMSVAFSAPLLAASVVLDVVSALAARAAAPAHLQQALAPLKAVGILAVVGFALEHIARAISGGQF